MFDYYFTFRSITPAQRAHAALEKAGILSRLIRAPKFLGKKGCAYALSVSSAQGSTSAAALKTAGVAYGAVYKVFLSGGYEEVSL